jgi:hypothetical protein
MFSDLDELEAYGFEFDQTVIVDLDQRTFCEFCYIQPAPRGHLGAGGLAEWASTESPSSASYFESASCTFEEHRRRRAEKASTPAMPLPQAEMSRLAVDSQLHNAVALPDRLLIPLAGALTDYQRDFVQNLLVVRICDICRNSDHADAENADLFIERVINVRCDGSPEQFEREQYHAAAREVAGLIQLEMLAQGA